MKLNEGYLRNFHLGSRLFSSNFGRYLVLPIFPLWWGPKCHSEIRGKTKTKAQIMRKIPYGRAGKVEDIASAVVWLASDEAGYVTGSNLLVDGGMTSQLISKAPYDSQALEGDTR